MIVAAIIFLVIIPLILKKSNEKNGVDNSELKNYYKHILSFFGIVAVMCLIPFAATKIDGVFNKNSKVAEADGFTIEGYEVILDVAIDNKVYVTENIDISFYEVGHHGIYKFTPTWLEYTGKDNKTIKRKSNILNYRAEGEKYTIDSVGKDKKRIKIGNPNVYVDGDKKYTIKYTYDMGKDPFSDFDEFIFHAFGEFWGTNINNPKIVINMPKELDGNKINFFTDKYRKQNVNNLVDYEVSGKTITITGKKGLSLYNKALTVDIELPDNYFVGGSWNYGWGSFIITMIVLMLTAYVILSWVKYGKDYEKKVPTVEFYAPDDLSSAEVGYVYNKRRVSKKLTISLIIELASKGYIKIDEIKDSKNKKNSQIRITKLHIKPKEPVVDHSKIPYHIIEVKKLKDSDDLLSNEAL